MAGLTDLFCWFSEHVRIAFFPMRRMTGDTGDPSPVIERQFLRNFHGWLHADRVLIGAHPLGMASDTEVRDGFYEQSTGCHVCGAMAAVTNRTVLFEFRDVSGKCMLIPYWHTNNETAADRVFHHPVYHMRTGHTVLYGSVSDP